MIKKKIKIPIYNAYLTVILDKDLKYIEKTFNTPNLNNYGAVTLKDESTFKHYVVAFENLDYSLIAHEIVHIINYLFLDVGLELDRVNDEAQAYLTSWLYDEILKIIKK